ncbi:hypothetical protein CDH04_08645 [Francisella adeliensis]|uniref:Uncharacterized protein n=1 Tax=Francisella adeliensis TaxID=2007306 RepID=A0A2Z4Y0F2_9GAMM|nr:hypothetical protein CDH04_08645 [Francisella adeliensis]
MMLFIIFRPAVDAPDVPGGDIALPTVNVMASVPDIRPSKKYKIINKSWLIGIYIKTILIIIILIKLIVNNSLYLVVKALIIAAVPKPIAVPTKRMLFM